MSKTITSAEYNAWLEHPLTKGLKRSFQQSITDPENQPSQYGTVTLEMYEALEDQLAAEQLNNKLLREALEAVIKVHGYESGIPVEALAQPSDTSALDTFVAEKVKEYGDEARRQMRHATKAVWQRDLAVEALENCRLLAARHRKEEWAGHIMRFCKDAGLSGSPIRNDSIKESEAMAQGEKKGV